MVVKKVPGALPVYMVYDARDRLVLTQDGNMRTGTLKWMYTKYDGLNRSVSTGLWNNSSTFSTHYNVALASTAYPTLSGTWEELTETFYDDYDWLATNTGQTFVKDMSTGDNTYLLAASSIWPYTQTPVQSFQTRGMVTGTKVKVLGAATELYSFLIILYALKAYGL